ncbi:MAG: nickel pincer cofactor biosynthesis protein LarB [Candidatus Latescibacteria bacterium]|nr:nickel pincer cofactor biosynthesis protein LarB [Candidatus Latescibacterota bacterium]
MHPDKIRDLLIHISEGRMGVDEAMETLRRLPFEDLGFATIDHHRALRKGFPEVIFCQGKTVEQVVEIAKRIAEQENGLLATRASVEVAEAIQGVIPHAIYHRAGRVVALKGHSDESTVERQGTILVISAGTSDLPVAEEAAVTAETMGNRVVCISDVGVAGIHRLFAHRDLILSASVIIVVAGMEGALPSVVGGLVDVPVIAVPTSVGYGASFGGLAALLAMLNSCASGVLVVNIDNGFGAGFAASLINRRRTFLTAESSGVDRPDGGKWVSPVD